MTLAVFKSYSRATLAMYSVLHLVNDAVVLILPPILPLIVTEFNLSNFEAGALAGITVISMAALQAPLGFLADRFPRRLLIMSGFLLLGVGSIIDSFAPSFYWLVVGQIFIGAGGSVYHPVGFSFTSYMYKGRRGKGLALGLQSSLGDIGVVLAFASEALLIPVGGWRLPLIIWGVVSVVSAVMTPMLLIDETNAPQHREKISWFEAVRALNAIATVILIFFFLVMCYRVIFTYAPLYLVSIGFDATTAASIAAVMVSFGIIGSIFGGLLSDNIGSRQTTMVSFSALCLTSISIMFFSNDLLVVISLLVASITIYAIYPAIYVMVTDITHTKEMGMSYGVIFSIGLAGGMLAILIAGLIADLLTLSYIYSFTAFISAMASIASCRLRRTLPHFSKDAG